jgi:hypothetical protein
MRKEELIGTAGEFYNSTIKVVWTEKVVSIVETTYVHNAYSRDGGGNGRGRERNCFYLLVNQEAQPLLGREMSRV